MTVEVNNIVITEDKITIEALAIEDIIMADDLFEDVEVPEVSYEFDRHAHNAAAMKYLWKVVNGNRKTKDEKSMGAKLEALKGTIIFLSESFRVTA